MVAKPLCPLYKNIIKPLDRARYPELRYNFKSISKFYCQLLRNLSPICQWHSPIVSELDYSQRTAAYGLASLTSAGLIKRDGSRKTGAYTVTDVAACNTTCATCSIALQCKDYKPV